MSFEVIEDIAADEEIFTNYGSLSLISSDGPRQLTMTTPLGSEYFENSNAACLCATCQK